jgi:hypothetical protein
MGILRYSILPYDRLAQAVLGEGQPHLRCGRCGGSSTQESAMGGAPESPGHPPSLEGRGCIGAMGRCGCGWVRVHSPARRLGRPPSQPAHQPARGRPTPRTPPPSSPLVAPAVVVALPWRPPPPPPHSTNTPPFPSIPQTSPQEFIPFPKQVRWKGVTWSFPPPAPRPPRWSPPSLAAPWRAAPPAHAPAAGCRPFP